MDIKKLLVEMADQENRATQYPLYEVQDVREICGPDLNNPDRTYYVCNTDSELFFESEGELEEYLQDHDENSYEYERDDFSPMECEEYHYVVQTFLTEEAAELYIHNQSHNLVKPRIYVNSAYRNFQLIQLVQELFNKYGVEIPHYWS